MEQKKASNSNSGCDSYHHIKFTQTYSVVLKYLKNRSKSSSLTLKCSDCNVQLSPTPFALFLLSVCESIQALPLAWILIKIGDIITSTIKDDHLLDRLTVIIRLAACVSAVTAYITVLAVVFSILLWRFPHSLLYCPETTPANASEFWIIAERYYSVCSKICLVIIFAIQLLIFHNSY